MTEPQADMVQTATPEDFLAAQKRRNRWIALGLVAFVMIVGLTTVFRLQSANLGPDGGFYFDGSMNVPQGEEGGSNE